MSDSDLKVLIRGILDKENFLVFFFQPFQMVFALTVFLTQLIQLPFHGGCVGLRVGLHDLEFQVDTPSLAVDSSLDVAPVDVDDLKFKVDTPSLDVDSSLDVAPVYVVDPKFKVETPSLDDDSTLVVALM